MLGTQFKLDTISFWIAGLRDGMGPLLTLFLVRQIHLSPQQVALCLAATGFGSLLAQIPAGFCYDRIRDQRFPLLGGSVVIALCACLMANCSSFFQIFSLQCLCGIAMSFLSEGLPALSVVISTAETFGRRIARNELFAKLGGFATLGLSGYLAQNLSISSIFFVTIGSAVAVVIATIILNHPGLSKIRERENRNSLREFGSLFDADFLILLTLSFLFQLSNAPMFMVFEQALARSSSTNAPSIVAFATMFTQIVFVIACVLITRLKRFTPSFMNMAFGFTFVIVRGLFFANSAVSTSSTTLVCVQILDALAAAILILVPIQIIAHTKASNFNVASSVLGLVVIAGASLGMTLGGFLIENAGTRFAFLSFTSLALLGLVLATIASRRREDIQFKPDSTLEIGTL